jgi:uncharacterized protein YjbI with pentapeptide repeats
MLAASVLDRDAHYMKKKQQAQNKKHRVEDAIRRQEEILQRIKDEEKGKHRRKSLQDKQGGDSIVKVIAQNKATEPTSVNSSRKVTRPINQSIPKTVVKNKRFLEQYAAGTRIFQNIDLSEADLSGVNLQEVYFLGVNLCKVNLQKAILQGVGLSSENLQDADLREAYLQANLEGANLTNADLRGANLHKARLKGANLQGANLQGVDLHKKNLVGVNLQEANLQGANLQGANLQEVNLVGATLKGADFQGANLKGVDFHKKNLVGINFQEANLQMANLQTANLQEANLLGADLRKAHLQGANLRLTNLKGANLLYTNLQGANLQGANLQGAKLISTGTALRKVNFQEANLQGLHLQGFDLSGANLQGANLQQANLQDTNLTGANLQQTNLQGANLQGAKLPSIKKMQGVNLCGANLQEIRLPYGEDIHKLRLQTEGISDNRNVIPIQPLVSKEEALVEIIPKDYPPIKELILNQPIEEVAIEKNQEILKTTIQVATAEIEAIAAANEYLDAEGYFTPKSLKEAKAHITISVARRQGQSKFRQSLLEAYNYRCAITGCNAQEALEAAHIIPYSETENNHLSNGLLLRADLHTLFDLDLIAINPETMKVHLAPSLRRTDYGELDGKSLKLPKNKAYFPRRDALQWRCNQCWWYS